VQTWPVRKSLTARGQKLPEGLVRGTWKRHEGHTGRSGWWKTMWKMVERARRRESKRTSLTVK